MPLTGVVLMKQPIAGVVPSSLEERTVMVVWPSIAAYPSGRWLGQWYANDTGPYVFTIGNFIALASIPHALALYFYRLLPSIFGAELHGSNYKLTNRRIIELRSEITFRDRFPFFRFHHECEVMSVDLDRFDTVEIDRKPGQHWFDAGDLVFMREGVETFRLAGVSRPEAFRQTCVKSRMSFVGVKRALDHEAARA
jgi:hypothetical protein